MTLVVSESLVRMYAVMVVQSLWLVIMEGSSAMLPVEMEEGRIPDLRKSVHIGFF